MCEMAINQTRTALDQWHDDNLHVENREAVEDYLCKHPEVLRALREISQNIKAAFKGCQLAVSVCHDSVGSGRYLTLRIKMPAYEDGFFDRLDEVTDGILGEMRPTGGWINVTADFGVQQ